MNTIWKRTLSVLLAVLLLVGSVPAAGLTGVADFLSVTASAETVSGKCGEAVTWNFDTETGVLTISGTGAMEPFLYESWDSYRSSVQTVKIGSGVTDVGAYAFYGCKKLAGVTIPDSVTSIGEYAFYNCTSLANVTIPNSVTSIGDYAFDDCSNLAGVTVGSGVTSIGEKAFDGCTCLASFTVDPGNPAYSSDTYGALYSKDKTTLIQYPAGNARAAFTIPDGVTCIGSYAFYGCLGITNVTIPDSVTSIGTAAFTFCTNLADVTLPDGVTRIGDAAFYGCTSLADVTLPDSVTSIGEKAFSYCTSLMSVTVPNGVTSIGENAFSHCLNLLDVTIPNSVTSIGKLAFCGCAGLTSVTIPDGVTSIGRKAFSCCMNLDSVSIPKSVTAIGYGAFMEHVDPEEFDVVQEAYDAMVLSGESVLDGIPLEVALEVLREYLDHPQGVLRDVYYAGTQAGWNAIDIDAENDDLLHAAVHFYSAPHAYDLQTALTVSQTRVVRNAASDNEEYKKIFFDGMGTALDGANGTPDYTIPGLRKEDNMIPQGIAFWPERQAVLISAYSPDKSRPSTIYAMNAKTGEFTAQYSLRTQSGADCFANVGGIAVSANNLYLAYGKGVAYIPLDDFTDGDDALTIAGERSFAAELGGANVSYASVTDYVLYIGNYYEASSSAYNTPAGSTKSAVLGIPLSGASSAAEWAAFRGTAARRYALPNQITNVQGATISQGRLYLNCSSGRTIDGALRVSKPLADPAASQKLSASSFRTVKGLPMLGDMEMYDGYLYTLTNSAAFIYKEDGDGKGNSKFPTDAVWRIACGDLLSANEYTSINFVTKSMIDAAVISVGFRNDWFNRTSTTYIPPTTYNHSLGTFCSDISFLGYATSFLGISAETYIREQLTRLGFTIPANLINMETGRDEVNYFVATKEIGDDLLVLVATIGTYKDQWYSDFDPNGVDRESGTSTDENYHRGFKDAEEYVYNILEKNQSSIIDYTKYDKSNVKWLFTGHSRGAAAANLLAARFVDDAQTGSGMAQDGNIYAYTFATPNSVKNSVNVSAARYNCIFNIVNPEDFVTKVLPTDWGYARFGVTYVLPSITNTKSELYKNVYLKNVQNYYAQHLGSELLFNYVPYKEGDSYVGELATYEAVKLLTSRVQSVDDMYKNENAWIIRDLIPMKVSPYSFFQSMMAPLANIMDWDVHRIVSWQAIKEIVPALANIAQVSFTKRPTEQSRFFKKILLYFLSPIGEPLFAIVDDLKNLNLDTATAEKIKEIYALLDKGIYFKNAHQPQTYCAYMHTMGALTKSGGTTGYLHSVNGPVNVEVYDKQTGELAGRIADNTVDTAVAGQDNAIVMHTDGDSKMFWLPASGEYEIRLVGNGTGTMDYTVAAIDSDTGENENDRVNFFDVPITNGKVITGDVTAEDFPLETYVLASGSGKITPTETDEEAGKTLTVSAVVSGDGYATGAVRAVSGDYVMLTAAANEGSSFIGWYENGSLIDNGEEYAFVVKRSRNLTAKFEKVPAGAHTVKVTASDGGSVTGGGIFDKGTTVTVTAAPDKGYTFDGWYDGETKVSDSASYTFTVTKDVVLTATFRVSQYIPGDACRDGEVTLKDAALIQRYLVGGWNVTIDPDAADVDNDGSVTLKDAALIQRYLVGGWGTVLC